MFKFLKTHYKNCSKNNINHKLTQLENLIMATKAEVMKAIADEKLEITAKINDVNKQIQDLKDQIAAGNPVTSADLDEIVSAVHDIFVE